jgi:hypothetical protein
MSRWKRIRYPGSRPPTIACVYVFYGNGRPVYIGSTSNLFARLHGHRISRLSAHRWATPWGTFRTLWVKYRIAKRYGEWAMAELRLIRRVPTEANCKDWVFQYVRDSLCGRIRIAEASLNKQNV